MRLHTYLWSSGALNPLVSSSLRRPATTMDPTQAASGETPSLAGTGADTTQPTPTPAAGADGRVLRAAAAETTLPQPPPPAGAEGRTPRAAAAAASRGWSSLAPRPGRGGPALATSDAASGPSNGEDRSAVALPGTTPARPTLDALDATSLIGAQAPGQDQPPAPEDFDQRPRPADAALASAPGRRGRPAVSRARSVRDAASRTPLHRRGGAAAVAPRRRRYPALDFFDTTWSRPDRVGAPPPDVDFIEDSIDEDDSARDIDDSAVIIDALPPAGTYTGRAAAPLPAVSGPADLAPGRFVSPGGPGAAAPAQSALPPLPPYLAPHLPAAFAAPPPPAPGFDMHITARLGLLRASRTGAALDFAFIPAPTDTELLSVQPSAARILFCAPRVEAMARVSSASEETERAKAEKARRTSAASPWHTHSTDQLQLFVFTAWQVIFRETPNTALLGLQLGLAANWHIADQEDFANQGPFLLNRQEGARLFATLEAAALACSRATPPGALSPALVAQIKANLVQFFRLRAEAVLPWCSPPAGTPQARDVSLIARAIVHQYLGIKRAFDYALQAISEVCAGRTGDAQTENAAFLAIARPFYGAYLRNGMSNILAEAAVKQNLAYVPPTFLAAANNDVASIWAHLLDARASQGPAGEPPPNATQPKAAAPPCTLPRAADNARASPPRNRSPARQRSPGRQRSPARQRRASPARAADPEPLAVPTSRTIIGACSPHGSSTFRCTACSTPGHRAYECPRAFFRAFGKVMPGQREDGSQDPTAWSNNELVPAARADLAEYLRWTRVPINRRCPVSIALIAAGP